MVNLNLELGSIALPVIFFLFTKSLKQTLSNKILGEDNWNKSINNQSNNFTINNLSQTFKLMIYEVELNRVNFCNKYNGKQLTKTDWQKIKDDCLNKSLSYIVAPQLIPIWFECSNNLDKFCTNVNWIEMKDCFFELFIEQDIQKIQNWYYNQFSHVFQQLIYLKSCVRRHSSMFRKQKLNQNYG